MTRSLIKHGVVIGALALAHVAAADPRHVLVLKPEGNANADTKSKIDAQVVKLAKNLDGNIEAGEITFADASAAVGCSGSEAQCRDDVLSTMGVDEVVSISISQLPSGDVRVLVHRIPKGTAIKDAQSTIPSGQSFDAKLASDIGPIFGLKAKAGAAATAGAATSPTTGGAAATGAAGATTTGTAGSSPAGTSGGGAWSGPNPGGGSASGTASIGASGTASAGTTGTTGATTAGATTGTGGATGTAAAPTRTAQVDPTVTGAPNGQIAPPPNEGRSSNRAVAGLAVGGGLILLSIVMYAEASSTQSDINSAPTRTPNDFKNLQDLESRGDTFAGLGNIFLIGGVVVSGISGYFFWKGHRGGSSSQARLAPTVFDHGAGLALTVGGAP